MGRFRAAVAEGHLAHVWRPGQKHAPDVHGWCRAEDHPTVQRLQQQLSEYMAGQRTAFTLPLRVSGSAFAQAVYSTLAQVPYGQVISYGQLATAAGYPKAARAVGRAMAHNPLLLVIPCHRVVSGNGSLGGYAAGAELKRLLLSIEQTQR